MTHESAFKYNIVFAPRSTLFPYTTLFRSKVQTALSWWSILYVPCVRLLHARVCTSSGQLQYVLKVKRKSVRLTQGHLITPDGNPSLPLTFGLLHNQNSSLIINHVGFPSRWSSFRLWPTKGSFPLSCLQIGSLWRRVFEGWRRFQ